MSSQRSDSGTLYHSGENAFHQRTAFTNGEIPVTVYGLGKMGLPLAAVYADVSGNTVGVDVDPEVVDQINDGESPVTREPGLEELVADVVERNAFRATTEGEEAARRGSVHVVIVPTLLTADQEPELSVLREVVRTIGDGLSPGDLVVIESTVPPRTTRDTVVPLLSERSGLDPAAFGVAACPERTVSGQALADIRGTHPKVVGGADAESTRVASLIYDEITDNKIIEVADATTAEAVKVFEGVYRDINIALANQLALYASELDIDVTDAIDVANTQPFCEIHDPGPGVGGHCIPVYPYFLSSAFEADSSLLDTARAVNDRMPAHTVEQLEAILDAEGQDLAGARVLLLGLTYKAGIDELRNAPAVRIAQLLDERGAAVLGADPVLSDWAELTTVERVRMEHVERVQADVVAVVTPHPEVTAVAFDEIDAPILDGRNALSGQRIEGPVYTIGGQWP
jgi:UDP-N-acetyl-D-mannosaminuronic acid dehydrogenase